MLKPSGGFLKRIFNPRNQTDKPAKTGGIFGNIASAFGRKKSSSSSSSAVPRKPMGGGMMKSNMGNRMRDRMMNRMKGRMSEREY